VGQYDAVAGEWVNDTPATDTAATAFVVAAGGGQGLTSDNQYFYWGHGTGAGSIYKLDPATGSILATFSGPNHPAGGDYRANRDTLLFSAGAHATRDGLGDRQDGRHEAAVVGFQRRRLRGGLPRRIG
jgi:hypothetical protein